MHSLTEGFFVIQENIESKKAKIKMMIEVRKEKMKEFRDSSEMSRVSTGEMLCCFTH